MDRIKCRVYTGINEEGVLGRGAADTDRRGVGDTSVGDIDTSTAVRRRRASGGSSARSSTGRASARGIGLVVLAMVMVVLVVVVMLVLEPCGACGGEHGPKRSSKH